MSATYTPEPGGMYEARVRTYARQHDAQAIATDPRAIRVAQRERKLGASIDAIADMFRVSRRTVYRWLKVQVQTVQLGDWTAPGQEEAGL